MQSYGEDHQEGHLLLHVPETCSTRRLALAEDEKEQHSQIGRDIRVMKMSKKRTIDAVHNFLAFRVLLYMFKHYSVVSF
jgi:hypothetical protein